MIASRSLGDPSVGARFAALAVTASIAASGADCSHRASQDTVDATDVAAPDDAIATDTVTDAQPDSSWCAALHARMPSLPSGTYAIRADGSLGTDGLSVFCDMDSCSGGWTLVFAPTSLNYSTHGPPTLVTGSEPVLADSHAVLLALRDADLHTLGTTASFALPDDWRTPGPFAPQSRDIDLSVSIACGPSAVHTLRYGWGDFGFNTCDGDWSPSAQFGRICVRGTNAPFYAGFGEVWGDNCSTSDSRVLGAAPDCSAAHQFTIAVR